MFQFLGRFPPYCCLTFLKMQEDESLNAQLLEAATTELDKIPAEELLTPSLKEIGAHLLVYQSQDQLKKGKADKRTFLSLEVLGVMLKEYDLELPAFTYDKGCSVVVICLLCGVGPEKDLMYRAGFIYTPDEKSSTDAEGIKASSKASPTASSAEKRKRPRSED